MVSSFSVNEVMSFCYKCDFDFSEDESSCDEGEEVHTYRGPRVIAPEEVAALIRVVTSEPIASDSSSASVDRIFASADISTGAEEEQGQF